MNASKFNLQWPIWFAIAAGFAALYVGLLLPQDPELQWSAPTRFTARIAFPFLIAAYVARPLFELTRAEWAKSLFARRRYMGLAFAAAHAIHLLAIVLLFIELDEAPDLITLIFGGIAYFLIFAMALTSNSFAMKALGARWKQLHWIGIHYLWLIFAQSYIGRIFEPSYIIEGLIGTAVVIVAAAIRAMAFLGKKRVSRT